MAFTGSGGGDVCWPRACRARLALPSINVVIRRTAWINPTRKIVSAALGTASMVSFAIPVPRGGEIAREWCWGWPIPCSRHSRAIRPPRIRLLPEVSSKAVDRVRDQINDSFLEDRR